MAVWKCRECGKKFRRDRSGLRPVRFCSQPCYHGWMRKNRAYKGCFPKGITPWNTGTKGICKPNVGSFKKGRINEAKQPIGAVTIRIDKSGKERAWVKVAENGNVYDWKPRAVVAWEKDRGRTLPRGLIVHHKDRNTLNDDPLNLQSVSRSRHIKEHRHEFEDKRSKAAGKAAKARHARNRAAREQNT